MCGHNTPTCNKKLGMRKFERDVTYIVLSVYLRLSIDIYLTGNSPIRHKVNLIQLKTFEFELSSHN